MAFPCFDGSYLPKQESEFVHLVLDELAEYQHKSNHKSVLLFPPLPSRLRYLIHRTTEDMPNLTTFSIGESFCRRVVVCYSDAISLYEEPPWPRGRGVVERTAKPKPSTSLQNRGPKRPDQPLYMPRAVRQRLSLQNAPVPPKGQVVSSPGFSGCSCMSSSSSSCSCSDRTENTQSLSTSNQESLPSMPHNVADNMCDCGPSSSPPCPESEKQDVVLNLHEANPLDWNQIVSYFSAVAVDDKKEDLASVPHSNQTEDKSADTADLTEEVIPHFGGSTYVIFFFSR
uniref:R3H domain-containing protein n=1 Tax=Myripristis murdjan TaxID=586833 RepID=A0A667XY33_9TELE